MPQFLPRCKSDRTSPATELLRAKGHDGSMVIETLLKQVPHLLKASVRQKRFDLLAIAWDLCATTFAGNNVGSCRY